MRDVFAILAIIAAVVGLGVFRVPDENALVAAGITVAAERALYQSAHPLSVVVKDRVVTVSGRVESAGDRDWALGQLRGLDGVDEVRDALVLLPQVAPFVLWIEKDEGAVRVGGHVPSEALAADLGGALGVAVELPLGAGAPGGFADAARLGAQALDHLLDGRVSVEDQEVALEGVAHLPADLAAVEAVLAGLPEGFGVTQDITVLDDGRPYGLVITRDSVMGLEIRGKLPPDFVVARFDVLGAAQVMEVTQAPLPLDQPGFAAAVDVVLAWMAAQGAAAARGAGDIGDESGVAVAGGAGVAAQADAAVKPADAGDAASAAGDRDARGAAALADASAGAGAGTAQAVIAPGLISLTGGARPEAALPEGYALYHAPRPEAEDQPWQVQVDWAEGRAVVAGHVPRGADLDAFGAQGAVTYSNFPDLNGWMAGIGPGWEALQELDSGRLTYGPEGLAVTGLARDPLRRRTAQAALGAAGTLAVDLLDDGRPAAFVVRFDAAAGGSVTGKLPRAVRMADMAAALGLEALRGRPAIAPEGAAEDVMADLAQLGAGLEWVETAVYRFPERAWEITLTPGVDAAAWAAAHRLSGAGAAPAALGTRRMHLASGQAQVFADGFWLPELGMQMDKAGCDAAAADLDRPAFAPGQFGLTYEAHWVLAHWAAVLRGCTGIAGLQAEIIGTASGTGFDVLDQQLARRRAETIRAAMVARGVAAADMATVGLAGGEADMRLRFAQGG